tara:strand:+ start:5370 stop:5996 length:627 start_codon:yes stop_codon:yes gene_type:complete
MKILHCDIDSTVNNHWVRIQKWSRGTSKDRIHWKAFIKKELMKDQPLEGSREALNKLSKKYSINFLTARGFNAYGKWRIIPESTYDKKFGFIALKINNFLSLIWSLFSDEKTKNKNKYAFSITKEWLDSHGFQYDTITIVDTMDDKIKILQNTNSDLFIDDMSWGQNYVGSYVNLYENTIIELDKMNIKYEIFNKENNWFNIVKKYYP